MEQGASRLLCMYALADYPRLSKINMQKAFGAKGIVCTDIEAAFIRINENTADPEHFLEQADVLCARVQVAAFTARQAV